MMMAMAAAAASPVGILRSPAALRPYAAPRRPAASCSFQLCAAPAHLRAMSQPAPRPSPRVAPRLRCALSDEAACVAQDDGEYVFVPLPPWVDDEELDEIIALDMSRAAIHERFNRESVEALAAVVGAVAGVFRPLWDNLNDVRNFKYVHEIEEFHIGMPFGALMTCIGMYQLWKVAPNLCLDVAMPYAFYKLSVMAADVRRRGFSPDLIIRIKLALALAMFMKDIHLKCTPLSFVRVSVCFMYALSVLWDLSGEKKLAKYALATMIYQVACFLQNSKSMFDFPEEKLDAAEKVDGGVLVCVREPDNSRLCGAKEGGETQFVSGPDNSRLCGAKEGGETLQFLHGPDTAIELNYSSSVKEDGKLQNFTSKSHHANKEENTGELQSVPKPGDSSCNLKEESELPQFVAEPDQY